MGSAVLELTLAKEMEKESTELLRFPLSLPSLLSCVCGDGQFLKLAHFSFLWPVFSFMSRDPVTRRLCQRVRQREKLTTLIKNGGKTNKNTASV